MRLNRILVTCAALLSCAAVGCSKSSPSRPGAQTLSFGGTTWEVLDGTWSVNGDTLVGSGGSIWTLKDYSDGAIDLDVETPAQGGDRTVGVGFHITATGGDPQKSNGYGFNFTAAQTFNVFKGTANSWQPMNPAQTSFQKGDGLQPDKNQIHVEMNGGHYRVSANGRQMADFQDASYGTGRYKLFVESSAWQAKFSQLRIR